MDGRGHCREFTYRVLRENMFIGASDENIYEWVRVRRLFVANSRHPVLATIKTPKISYKIPESAVSCTLLMSGFQIFAAHTAFQNRAARDFFTHPTKKNALSFPDFCQKAWPKSHFVHCHTGGCKCVSMRMCIHRCWRMSRFNHVAFEGCCQELGLEEFSSSCLSNLWWLNFHAGQKFRAMETSSTEGHYGCC